MKDIRKAAVAGLFYPSDKEKLISEIQLLLSSAESTEKISGIIGIISPHAGYIYSGKTAAYAFNLLRGKKIKNVIIISPSHREYFPGSCVFSGSSYETPLGIVEVNKNLAEKLVEGSKTLFTGIKGHREEHAIEVQIPFLQNILSDFKIVPVVMGDQSKLFVDELAKGLIKILDEETVIVASSDLSHYHSKKKADELDSIVESSIRDFDYENLQKYLDTGICEACGGGPIIAMMKAAALKNKQNSLILNRSDSGDTTGDFNEVVGYLSAVVYGE